MSLATWFAIAAVVIAGFGASALIWSVIDATREELAGFRGWEGMHFDGLSERDGA